MTSIRFIKKCLWASAILLLINAITVLFMPMATKLSESTNKISLIAVGITFWTSLLVGYVILIIANKERKYFLLKKCRIRTNMNCPPGIISFFSNIPASIADGILIGSIVTMIVLWLLKLMTGYLPFVTLFLIFFSFNMHCMLNGRIYKVTKYKRVRSMEEHE